MKVGGNLYKYKLRYLKPDGKITYVIIRSNALRKKSGMIYGYVGTVTDITGEVIKQNQILEKKRRLKLAQSLAHIGDWTYDYVNDMGEWSDEMFNIFELDNNRVPLFTEFLDWVHPDDRNRLLEANNKALEEKSINKIKYRLTTPKGNEKLISAYVTFVPASNGFPDRLSGTAQDITECVKSLTQSIASDSDPVS